MAPQTVANQLSASEIKGVTTPCGAVPTREAATFVSSVLDLQMYGRVSLSEMRPYYSRVTLAPRTPADQRVALGFPHRAGAVSPLRNLFFVPDVLKLQCIEGFMIRVWDRTFPGWWWHQLKPISKEPVGSGFPHLTGRYRPGGPSLSSLFCWSCRYMKGFMIRGWGPVLLGRR